MYQPLLPLNKKTSAILETTALNLGMDLGKNEIFIMLIIPVYKYVLTFYITVTL